MKVFCLIALAMVSTTTYFVNGDLPALPIVGSLPLGGLPIPGVDSLSTILSLTQIANQLISLITSLGGSNLLGSLVGGLPLPVGALPLPLPALPLPLPGGAGGLPTDSLIQALLKILNQVLALITKLGGSLPGGVTLPVTVPGGVTLPSVTLPVTVPIAGRRR